MHRLDDLDISANGGGFGKGLEIPVNMKDLPEALSKIERLETGRLLVVFQADMWKDVGEALRHSKLWQYYVTSDKTFNAVMKCVASHNVSQKIPQYKADNVVYVGRKPPHYSAIDTARDCMKHTRKLGALIFLHVEN
jgi:hypothetical protein